MAPFEHDKLLTKCQILEPLAASTTVCRERPQMLKAGPVIALKCGRAVCYQSDLESKNGDPGSKPNFVMLSR